MERYKTFSKIIRMGIRHWVSQCKDKLFFNQKVWVNNKTELHKGEIK